MDPEELKLRNFEDEIVYSASRSSGPGGQNINKVNTKIELRFSVMNTRILSEQEKDLIRDKLRNKINNADELVLSAQSERSQLMNKRSVTEKFFKLLAKALTKRRFRKSTKPTIASVKKRLEEKKNRGIRKKIRKTTGENHDDIR